MRLLGVGSTTIKRWADEGVLPCYRTAGGHRRFRERAVRQLAESSDSEQTTTHSSTTWLRWLTHRDLKFITANVQELVRDEEDWFSAADILCDVVREIGQTTADGGWTVIEEQAASMKLSQAISAVVTSLDVEDGSSMAVVATLAGERDATCALLAQACLRSTGWNALFLGTEVDSSLLVAHVEEECPSLLVVNASVRQSDATWLRHEAVRLGSTCKQTGIEFVMGGDGAWPDTPEYGYRCGSFAEFRDVAGAAH